MANTKDVGNLQVKLAMDVSSIEAGVVKATKALDTLDKTFQKSQQDIARSLGTLDASIKAVTKSVEVSMQSQQRAVESHTKAMHSSLTTNSRNIVNSVSADTNAIRTLEKSIVVELQKISTAFQQLGIVTNKNFTEGIDKLSKSTQVNTDKIVNNLRQVESQSKRTNDSLNKMQSPKIAPVSGGKEDTNKYGGFFGSLGSGGAGNALKVLNRLSGAVMVIEQAVNYAVQGFNALIGKGMQFASTLETLQLGYAGIISSTMLQDGKEIPYENALKISTGLLQLMQDEALKTSLTLEELGTALQSTMAIGVNAGMSLQQVLDLTVVGAQAVKTFGLSNQQVAQELRGLISGDAIRPGVDMLATVLGYTTATVNQLRAEGKLYDDVIARMSGFKAASNEFQNTWGGIISNLEDGVSRVFGLAMQSSGLFDTFKEKAKELQEIFFTIQKSTVTLENGKQQDVFKINVNENTVAMLQTVYSVFKKLIDILTPFAKILGQVLVIGFKRSAAIITVLVNVLHALVTVLTPVWEGISALLNIIDKVSSYIINFVKSIEISNETLTKLSAILAVVGGAILALVSPAIAVGALIVGAVGAIAIAWKDLKGVINAFATWFVAKARQIGLNALALKEQFKDMVRIDRDSNQDSGAQYRAEAQRYGEIAASAWGEVERGMGDAANTVFDTISNKFEEAKKQASLTMEEIEKWFRGLAKKPTDTNVPKNDFGVQKRGSALKSAYKALEKELDKFKTATAESQAQLKFLYDKDLMATQSYVEQTLALKKDLIDKEIENLEKRKKVAQEAGQEDDVKQFSNKIDDLNVQKVNLEKQAARELSDEYKKLDDRLKEVAKTYEDVVGKSDEAFKADLVKEYAAILSRTTKELEEANTRLGTSYVNSSQSEKAMWTERKQILEETITKLRKVIEMKGLEREASKAQAEIEKINLSIQEQQLNNRINRGREWTSENAKEMEQWQLKQRYMDNYIERYTDLIAAYEKEYQLSLQSGDLEKANQFKQLALEAKENLLELREELNPIMKDIQGDLKSGFADAFQSMWWGEKSFGQAFEDLATNFSKQFTQRMFEEITSGIFDNLFKTLTPNEEVDIAKTVEVKATANMTGFVDTVQDAALTAQQALTTQFVPAVQQAASSLTQLVSQNSGGTGFGNIFGSMPAAEGAGGWEVYNTGVPSSESTSEMLGGLLTSFDALSKSSTTLGESFGATKGTVKGFDVSTEQATLANDTVKDSAGVLGDMAIPAMITSMLSASGVLGKFGVALQALIQIMAIAKSANMFGFASGGYVQGAGTGTSDSIPARLSNGEYVVKASAVNALGVNFLDRLNSVGGAGVKRSARLPKFAFAEGGYVEEAEQPMPIRNEETPMINTAPNITMQMTFQSVDPEANMRLMREQYPVIKNMLIQDLQKSTSMRRAVKGASN